MHKICKSDCGGNLVKHFEDKNVLKFICDKCGRIVEQKKRKANNEVRKVVLYKAEWERIIRALDYYASKDIIEKYSEYLLTIELRKKLIRICKPRFKPGILSKIKKKKFKVAKKIEEKFLQI